MLSKLIKMRRDSLSLHRSLHVECTAGQRFVFATQLVQSLTSINPVCAWKVRINIIECKQSSNTITIIIKIPP